MTKTKSATNSGDEPPAQDIDEGDAAAELTEPDLTEEHEESAAEASL